jgi:hypothetical protein
MRCKIHRPVRAFFGILAALALTACGVVDQFSSRAMTYNDQAETIKEQQFLVNIMRAAYREPLQFSDFSQVTGQASISGTAGFTLPMATVPANLMRTYVASPGTSVSGTQTFSVTNLDTQQFYQGILAPIPLTSIAYYTEADYPKALLLTLFVSHIELKSESDPSHVIGYYNSVYGNYTKFEAVLQAAIDLGLTTEAVDATQTIGPPMTATQLQDLKYLTEVSSQNMALKTYELGAGTEHPPDPNLSAAQQQAFMQQHVTEYFRLVSKTTKNRFCFAGNFGPDGSVTDLALANQDLNAANVMTNGRTLSKIVIPPSDICGAKQTGESADDEEDDSSGNAAQGVEIDVSSAGQPVAEKFKIVITTRSVEGMLYYLGEWARGELQVGGQGPVSPPMVRTDAGTDALFVVRRSCSLGMPSIAAPYFGGQYCIEIDPSGQDRSSEVMEIALQLFALNNSAQNLPSPNVISVLSQ